MLLANFEAIKINGDDRFRREGTLTKLQAEFDQELVKRVKKISAKNTSSKLDSVAFATLFGGNTRFGAPAMLAA